MPRPVKDGSLQVGGRTVQVSSVAKPFFPDAGLVKGDLVAYYRDVAEVMLPYLRGRPLNLQRFPNGVNGKGFWQQGASEHFPDWIRTVTVERRGRGGTVDHVVCDDAATIVYLANLSTVTFHAWTSTVEHLARPDLVIIDLDPDPDQGLEVVRAAARSVKAACEEVGLASFIQTSGSRGYHVVMPLQPGPDVEVVRDFAAELALLVAARDPDRLSVEWRKAKRDGRLLLDTARDGLRPDPGRPLLGPAQAGGAGRHPDRVVRARPGRAPHLHRGQPAPPPGPQARPVGGHGRPRRRLRPGPVPPGRAPRRGGPARLSLRRPRPG